MEHLDRNAETGRGHRPSHALEAEAERRRGWRHPGRAPFAFVSALALAAALTIPHAVLAAPAVLQDVRSWSDTEKLRLVLDLNRIVNYRTSPGENGEFRVFLPGTVPSPTLSREILFEDAPVQSVRMGERTDGLEVVFVMSPPRTVTPFDLAASGDQPYRVVFDVPRSGVTLPPPPARTATNVVPPATIAASGSADRIIVIDPGHGGEHTGAVGHMRTIEKLVTLTISKKIMERLEGQKGVRVLMTRYGDYNVDLRQRYRMADSCRADVFVSIHANSSKRRNNRGTEVFFLSLDSASDEQAALLADIENAADAVESNAFEEDVTSILVDLKQQESLKHSQWLAEAILNHITEDRRLSSRGVKQAPFAVLKSPITPSVLVETAFINHPEEAKLLRDPAFQDRIADQIVRGIMDYLKIAPVTARNGAAENYFQKALAKKNGR